MSAYAEIAASAAKAGQSHVLRYYETLDAPRREAFLAQLAGIDWAALPGLIRDYVLNKPKTGIPADLGPAPFFPLTPRTAEEAARYARADEAGIELLRAGRVSLLTVAGGQGTRLGFDGPKGTYPICPVSGETLFAYFAETIRRAGKKYGKPLTWYIMTSLLNREATEKFFRENDYFGLDSGKVVFFSQGTMPAIGYDGKLLLAAPDSLSLSPDGHGGTLLALRKSGCLDRMRREGVDTISYFQVDNPLAPMVNPRFIGLHHLENSQMSAISLTKTGPFEKLGNFCVSGGRLEIIEYSDLPAELAESRDADGRLRFVAGSPAIHVLSREFVEHLTSGGNLRLPWHRADKKVPCLDADGNPVKPETPNAVKLESFIFDALPLADRTMVMEGDRAAMFAPTKNPTGVDSVESCRAMLLARDAAWLAAAGHPVPAGAEIEISPLAAIDADDVKALAAAGRIPAFRAGEKRVIHG